MKKSAIFFMVAIFGMGLGGAAAEEAMKGKVIEETSGAVILEIEGTGALETGKEIELTYLAGVMEMLIGRFRVVSADQNRYTLAVVTLNMRPGKGMTVKVVPAMSLGDIILTDFRTRPVSEPPAQAPASGEILGKVAGVFGDDLLIEAASPGLPSVGDRAEVRYVTGSGMEIDVGTWRVTEVEGTRIKAAAVKKLTSPQKGLKVVFKSAADGQEAAVGSSDSAVFTGVFPSEPQNFGGYALPSDEDGRINLLGVPAPSGPPPVPAGNDIMLFGVSADPQAQGDSGEALNRNLFSSDYGRPVTAGVQKQEEEYLNQLSFEQKIKDERQGR